MCRISKNEKQDYVIGRFVQARNHQYSNRFRHVATSIGNTSLEDGIIYDAQSDKEIPIEISEIRLEDESEICGNYDNVSSKIEKELPQHYSEYELEITPPDFEDFCTEDSDSVWEEDKFPYMGFFSADPDVRIKSRNRFLNDILEALISLGEGRVAGSLGEHSSAIIWFGFSDNKLTAVLGNDNPFFIRNSFTALIHKNGRKGIRIRECPNDRSIEIFVGLTKKRLIKKMEKQAPGGFLLLFAGDIWTLPAFTEAKLQIVDKLKEFAKDQGKFQEIWYWHNWVDVGDKTPNLHRII